MQPLRLIVFVGLAVSISFAVAQDQKDEHAGHHPAPTTDSGASQASAEDGAGIRPSPAQENMNKVESLLQQVGKTDDPAQKRQLLGQHLQALRDQLRLMRGEHAPMKKSMKEDGKKEDGMKEGMMKKGDMMGGMMTMHRKVEQKLDMLERTIQQIVEREVAQDLLQQH